MRYECFGHSLCVGLCIPEARDHVHDGVISHFKVLGKKVAQVIEFHLVKTETVHGALERVQLVIDFSHPLVQGGAGELEAGGPQSLHRNPNM